MPGAPGGLPPSLAGLPGMPPSSAAGLLSLAGHAGLAGLPQLSLPLAGRDGAPMGLSLLGPRGSDRALVAMAERLGT
jgi:amidase